MDKIAVISDVHGNMTALEAVLADIKERGIDQIYNLGDLAGKGPHAARAIDRCREVCQVIVRGNWDDGLPKYDGAMSTWACAQIGAERVAYLSQLPNVYDFWLSGKRVRLYHASQENEYTRVQAWAPYETHRAMFDNTPFTGFDNGEPDVVGYGDIHRAYMLAFDHKVLFNAGSVGNPLDLTLATYAILNGNLGSQDPAAFSVDFVRVPYDIEKEVEEARQSHMPEFEAYAQELRTATFRGWVKAE